MASPCKRLCLVVLLLGCLLQAAQGEKWRAMPKIVRRCPGPPVAIEMLNLTLIPKNRATTFRITNTASFSKNVTFTSSRVNVYKTDGIRDQLFLIWTFDDVCERILQGHHFIDPIYGPEGLPRRCSFTKGTIPAIVDYDLHGDAGPVMKVRGDFMVEIKTFDQGEMVWCIQGYGTIRKDTLN